jgi:hypothetical protein
MINFKAIVGTVVFTVKKCSPEILLGVGVVGVVGSTVLACVATTKASQIIEKMEDESDRIDKCVELRESSELDDLRRLCGCDACQNGASYHANNAHSEENLR